MSTTKACQARKGASPRPDQRLPNPQGKPADKRRRHDCSQAFWQTRRSQPNHCQQKDPPEWTRGPESPAGLSTQVSMSAVAASISVVATDATSVGDMSSTVSCTRAEDDIATPTLTKRQEALNKQANAAKSQRLRRLLYGYHRAMCMTRQIMTASMAHVLSEFCTEQTAAQWHSSSRRRPQPARSN